MRMFKLSIGVFCLILALILGNAMVVTGESEEEDMSVPMGIILLEPPETVLPGTFPKLTESLSLQYHLQTT